MLGEYSMSTTLTNGLKLPDKGSVDWYADMQSNYAILDGAVGTIAEHTSALSGKAPLVHTHTKSDITDFPVYGTTAGTICEGNDSRLSDARTPVAHTHTKSDVTDLFNSANTWSAEQVALNNFYVVKENNYELGQSYPNGNHLSGLHIKDKNGATVGLLDIVDRSYGNMEMRIRIQQKFDPNSNNRSTSGDILYNEMILGITPAKTNYLGVNADLWGNNTYNLGTASSKWKTLNGINPGALSLPNTPGGTGTVNVNYYDLSGNITVRDGSTYNRITAPCDGWIAIGTFATWLQISNDTLILATTANPGADGFAQAFLPVRKGNSIRIVVNQTNTQFQSFKLLPCEGNV